jgi:hypothetical protein
LSYRGNPKPTCQAWQAGGTHAGRKGKGESMAQDKQSDSAAWIRRPGVHADADGTDAAIQQSVYRPEGRDVEKRSDPMNPALAYWLTFVHTLCQPAKRRQAEIIELPAERPKRRVGYHLDCLIL